MTNTPHIKLILITIVTILLAGIVLFIEKYLGNTGSISILRINENGGISFVPLENTELAIKTVTDKQSENKVDYKIQEIAKNLDVPWSIAFTADKRTLVTERK